MNYREAIKKINESNLIIAVGNEPFYRDQVFNKVIQTNPGHEVVRFDCSETPLKTIINTISFKDLFSTKRIFLLKNFLKLKKLTYFLERDFDDKIILDSEKIGRSKDFELLKEKGIYAECAKPKFWEEEDDFVGKAKAFTSSQGYSIDPESARYLFSQLGYNLYRLVRELQKLILYKDNPSRITISDIEAISLKSINYNVFDVIDHVLNGNKKKALELLEKIFKYEKSPGILLISLWYSHLESLLYLKTSDEQKTVNFVKMPPLTVKNKLLPQSKKITIKKIVWALNYLTEMDYNLRKSSFDLKYLIEKFVIAF